MAQKGVGKVRGLALIRVRLAKDERDNGRARGVQAGDKARHKGCE